MKNQTLLWPIITSFVILLTLTGCFRDPNVRKQRFLESGEHYFQHGKYSEATIQFENAIQIDKNFTEAHYQLAQCYLKQRLWANAYRELLVTISLDPQKMPAFIDLGRLLLSAGQYREARDRALTVLQSNPKQLDAQMLLATTDARLGDLKDALQEAAKAVEMGPNEAATYTTLGLIQEQADLSNEAETSLKKAKQLEPLSSKHSLNLAEFYADQKRWPEAEKEFRVAISLSPQDPTPRAALARMYVTQDQKSLAIEVLTEAKKQLGSNPEAYRLLGDYYLSEGDAEKALSEFAGLAKDHPEDLKVQKAYAELLILVHQADAASRLADEILKKSPNDPEALILQGQILLQKKKTDAALQILQQAVRGEPNNAAGHYQLGMAYLEKGDPGQAQAEWRETVRLRPSLLEAWIALGYQDIRTKDWRDLESIGHRLRSIAPNRPEGYLFHATARMNQDDSDGAEADLDELVKIDPKSALGYAKLGQLRAAEKRWSDSQKYYQEALSHSPDYFDAIQGVVNLDSLQGKSASALQFIQDQIKQNPDNAALFLLQGEVLLNDGQLVGAEQAFSRCLALDKNNLPAHILLGQVESALKKPGEAAMNYQSAIEIAPNNVRLFAALGGAYEAQGEWKKAQATYQQALAIRSDDAMSANNLAYLMLEHGESVSVALTLAQTARRGLPDLPNSADTLGWAYYHTGAYSAAIPLFEEAVKKVPNSATYRYHLALTYQKMNDSARANVEFQKVINLSPSSSLADDARRAMTGNSGG